MFVELRLGCFLNFIVLFELRVGMCLNVTGLLFEVCFILFVLDCLEMLCMVFEMFLELKVFKKARPFLFTNRRLYYWCLLCVCFHSCCYYKIPMIHMIYI